MARVNPSGNTPRSLPSAQADVEARLEALNTVDPRNRLYGFEQGVLEDAYRVTRRSHVSPSGAPARRMGPPSQDLVAESLAAGLPIASSRGEFATTTSYEQTLRKYGIDNDVSQAYAILQDEGADAATMGFDVTSGTYYDPQTYNNLAAKKRTQTYGPAAITQRPTSTSNPKRPRTVAAGYDKSRQVLTLVFRDGTFYNYYDVSPAMWQTFKSLPSKGKYIKRYLDAKPRGEAQMSYISKQAQELIYRVSRTNQILYQGNEQYRPRRQPNLQSRLNKAGKNTSKGGVNPAARRRRKP
jgi:hypothetical protein